MKHKVQQNIDHKFIWYTQNACDTDFANSVQTSLNESLF